MTTDLLWTDRKRLLMLLHHPRYNRANVDGPRLMVELVLTPARMRVMLLGAQG